MFIPDPDFYPSRIPDPESKTATKERGEKKFVVITFYVATNFTKLQIILVLKKKIWANFQRIIELFTQKIVTKLSIIPSNHLISSPFSNKIIFNFVKFVAT